MFGPGDGPQSDEADGVVWHIEHDVLGRETQVRTRYGGHYDGQHGSSIDDVYEGELGVSTVDPGRAWATGRAAFTIRWPRRRARPSAHVDVQSDADAIHVDDRARRPLDDGEPFATREWRESFPRTF